MPETCRWGDGIGGHTQRGSRCRPPAPRVGASPELVGSLLTLATIRAKVDGELRCLQGTKGGGPASVCSPGRAGHGSRPDCPAQPRKARPRLGPRTPGVQATGLRVRGKDSVPSCCHSCLHTRSAGRVTDTFFQQRTGCPVSPRCMARPRGQALLWVFGVPRISSPLAVRSRVPPAGVPSVHGACKRLC